MNTGDDRKPRARWRRWTDDLVNPRAHPRLEAALAQHRTDVPVLWLLGKTGAGKSSVIQRLTGDSRAEIGNGFEPCTRTSHFYNHPRQAPVMRFLDTRGLGESGYDPQEDLAACQHTSHALLVLTRVDDTSQAVLCQALARLARQPGALPALHLHSALHMISDPAHRQRAIDFNATQVRTALGRDIPQIRIDFLPQDDPDDDTGLTALSAGIIALVPELEVALATRDAHDSEHAAFLLNRREVLGYASAAAAVDVFPGVGLVGVPGIQGKLLHTLAARYEHTWDRQAARDFLAVLGTSFLYRYGMSFIGRQAAKLIPGYGQTAGAAAAAGISFASTYALGRAACLYLYRKSVGVDTDRATLQEAFKQAFDELHTRDHQ